MSNLKINLATLAFLAFVSFSNANIGSDCFPICPDIYNPVCGFNGLDFKKFNSPCELEVYNCEKQKSSEKSKISFHKILTHG